MKLKWERFWPILFGLLATGFFVWAWCRSWVDPDLKAGLSAVTTVGAIAIGFLGTAKSILISIKDTNPFLVDIQENGVLFDRLLQFMRDALHCCFLNVIISAIALFMSRDQSSTAYLVAILLVVFTGATGGAYCYRIMRHFFFILNRKG